jgi:hypothetical protein
MKEKYHCFRISTNKTVRWQIEGSLEALMQDAYVYIPNNILTTVGFENSGADWLEQYKKIHRRTECDCN